MPLETANSGSKKDINKAVSDNIHELVHFGTKQRPMNQVIAIAESAARKGKSKPGMSKGIGVSSKMKD